MHYLTLNLDLGVNVTRNISQFPLHHVTYAPVKFEIAESNDLRRDAFARNMTDGWTTDLLWYEIYIHAFLNKKWV